MCCKGLDLHFRRETSLSEVRIEPGKAKRAESKPAGGQRGNTKETECAVDFNSEAHRSYANGASTQKRMRQQADMKLRLAEQRAPGGAIIKSDFSKASTIRYNRIYMESIFLNLVGNAIKYKSEDRIPEIRITSELENGKIVLKFQDNGLGIDLEQHGHKLFGLNKVFHRHPDAKGVGLFLTKTQIEAMGGAISACSTVNVGTTFTIHFD